MFPINYVPQIDEWCAPAIGIYNNCMEFRYGFTVHNFISTVFNLLMTLLLVLSFITYLVVTRRVKFNVHFMTTMMMALFHVFMALWCIFREISYMPNWVTASMFSIAGGFFILPGLNYLVLCYREIQHIDILMIYSGIHKYKKWWMALTIIGVLWFCILYPLASISPLYYLIFGRIFFAGFSFFVVAIPGQGIQTGFKLIKMNRTLNVEANHIVRNIYALLFMVIVGGPTILFAAIWINIIDQIIILWHVFYFILELAGGAFSIMLVWWLWSNTYDSITTSIISTSNSLAVLSSNN